MGCLAQENMLTMQSLQLKLRPHRGRGELILSEPEDQDACDYIVFPGPDKEAALNMAT